jgi:hypothetical protein
MATARYRDEGMVGEVPAAPARNDAYTGMLIISLAAMVVGCVLLLMEYLSYDSQIHPPSVQLPQVAAPVRPGAAGPGGAAPSGVPGVPPAGPGAPGGRGAPGGPGGGAPPAPQPGR